MARILAAWDAGTTQAFVDLMNQTANQLGMTASKYTDPAGYDATTVSTASDQVILARKAMELPVFAEIVAMTKATIPITGTITNYNTLIGKDGVIGIKTGSTDQAGGCLSFAATVKVGDQQLTIVGAVLGQPGTATPQQLSAVFSVTQGLIKAVGKALVNHKVVTAGQEVAAVHGPLRTGTKLAAAKEVSVVGWPGLSVRLKLDVPQIPYTMASGTELGTLTVTAGDSTTSTSTALRTTSKMSHPSNWTRIKQHK
jgi:serine-type D-Ala-D-Ala carboxypeptidase (penicillin-binding protein 5/6)